MSVGVSCPSDARHWSIRWIPRHEKQMSTPIAENVTPTDQLESAEPPSVPSNEFDYRPVPILAPISIGISLLSLSTFLIVGGAVFGVLGVILALTCLWQISQSDGEYGGTKVAVFGLCCSILIPLAGISFQFYEYRNELPDGYVRVNFVRDISDKQFVYNTGARTLHADVKPLVGERIFIKGFMYQSKQMEGLKSFVLLKDNGECCFGGDPKPYDMIGVRMVDGMTVNGVDGLLSIGGVLKANVRAGEGEPVYILEADFFSKSRTIF